jgi:hypothetical protein
VTPDEIVLRAQLTGQERAVFLFLARHKMATIDEIVDHLYGNRADGGPLTAHTAARVILHRMRKRVAAYVRIEPEKFYTYQPLPR